MKLICIGRNYSEHARELGNEIPEEPVIFMKPKNALIQMHTPFYYPEFTNELHYECELVLRVSKNGKFINPKQALQYVNGITAGIDFTARDVQAICKQKGLPWEKAKAFDNSAGVGVFRNVSSDDLSVPIHFSMKKNGHLVQQGASDQMIFSFASLIANISMYFSLNIGDLIFTGTPAGVGECVVGDQLECFLENESVLKLEIR